MKTIIKQEFEATINSVVFNNSSNYYSTLYILQQIENKFGEVFNDKFIGDLQETLRLCWMKYENFSYDELEQEFYYCILIADTFEEINFTYCGIDWKTEVLNDGLLKGIYTM